MISRAPKGYLLDIEIAAEIKKSRKTKEDLRNIASRVSYISREHPKLKKFHKSNRGLGRYYFTEKTKDRIIKLYFKDLERRLKKYNGNGNGKGVNGYIKKKNPNYIYNPSYNLPNYLPEQVRLSRTKYFHPFFKIEIEESSRIWTREEEKILFTEYNFYRFKIAQIEKKIKGTKKDRKNIKKIMNLESTKIGYRNKMGEVEEEVRCTNFRFIAQIIGRLVRRDKRNSTGDIYRQCYYGILKAMERFNYNNGNRFLTYASWWITRHLQELIREKYIIKTPPYFKKDSENAENRKKMARSIFSIDALIDKEGNTSSAEELINPKGIAHAKYEKDVLLEKIISPKIKQIIENLDPRKKYIITKKFGFDGEEPQNLTEIGRTLNITKERVRQILKLTLKKEFKPKLRNIRKINTFLGNVLNRL